MKTRIAKFRNMEMNFDCIREADELVGYVRLTESVEVDFIDLPPEDVIAPQIAAIDESIRKVRVEAEVKIAGYEDQRQKLLAITVQ